MHVEVASPCGQVYVQSVSSKRRKILVVDDDIANRDVFSRLLGLIGHEVVLASHGGEAVSLFSEQTFDMIFMDCLMPEVNGFDATKQIRALEKERGLPRTPVVALTAHAQERSSSEADMDGLVRKPARLEELEAALAKYCQ
jgi:CheY-like chemotaxis protein